MEVALNPTATQPTQTDALRGVFALLLTPFGSGGSIDWAVYDRYVAWQAEQRPAGLFAVCGSSEMKWLTLPERLELARRTVAHAAGLPVLATANLEPDLALHDDEIARMRDTGVAGVVLVPPSGMARGRARFRDYLVARTEGATGPVILYEWPQVEDYLVPAELFGALVAEGRLQGLKDTTCTRDGIVAKQRVAGGATVFQANVAYLLDALEAGVGGVMAVDSAARCDLVVALWERFHAGDPAARSLHRELVFLDALLRQGYPATAKYLLTLQGLDFPQATRWPVQVPDEVFKALDVWQASAPRREA